MAKDSAIGWCHHTVNFWWGCVEFSLACINCYARTYDAMRGKVFDKALPEGETHWGAKASRWMKVESALLELRAHDAAARKAGVRYRIFVNSMSDFFEERADLEDARVAAFKAFAQCANLDILLLTKRAEYAYTWILAHPELYNAAFNNIWLGFTGENQKEFDRRWRFFRCLRPPVVWCSYEPACGPLVLPDDFVDRGKSAWIIAGGESGPKRSEWDLDWLTTLDRQTQFYGVPLFVKQDAGLYPGQQGRIPEALWARKEYPTAGVLV